MTKDEYEAFMDALDLALQVVYDSTDNGCTTYAYANLVGYRNKIRNDYDQRQKDDGFSIQNR